MASLSDVEDDEKHQQQQKHDEDEKKQHHHHHDDDDGSRNIWKSLSVSIERSTKTTFDTNHYDDEKLQKIANQELEITNSAENVGMFYGLEVIDGSNYTVEMKNHTKTFRVKGEEQQQQSIRGAAAKKKKKKKKKKQPPTSDNDVEQDVAKDDDPSLLKKQPQELPKETKTSQGVKSLSGGKKGKKRRRVEKAAAAAAQQSSHDDGESATVETDSITDHDDTATKATRNTDDTLQNDNNDVDDDTIISQLQDGWMMATGGVILHKELCRSLSQQEFWTPTPIQAATLPAAILGRRNLVGAAPTGSGKTLAYLLPILQHLLENDNNDSCLKAFIILPTRELALQVVKECEKLTSRKKICGIFVGGLAEHKQSRVLIKQRPPIVIGTPGRLWKLMSSGEYEHLNDLSQVKYLVMDEADRMVQQGSFPQLKQILMSIHEANPMNDDDDEEESDDDDDDMDDRMLGLPGIPGEAKVQMLDDVLERLKQQQQGDDDDNNFQPPPEPMEMNDDEYEEARKEEEELLNNDNDDDIVDLPRPPIQRQTFIYSATLTLLSTTDGAAQSKQNKRNKRRTTTTVDGALAELLEKSHAKGPTKVVDLTSSNKFVVANSSNNKNKKEQIVHQVNSTTTRNDDGNNNKKTSSSHNNTTQLQRRLPPGLDLRCVKCTQKHKDSHLYAFLVTTIQGTSGPCLIFCNSIAAVKRVGTMLQTLKLPCVKMLHANMPQKARFKAVESLSKTKRSIVVATDVAARGLDIPCVSTVIHYDIARQVDIFVHRAGRTARGIGEKAIGCSVSFVAPNEDKAHDRICSILGNTTTLFTPVDIDGRFLSEAKERVHLANKIITCNEMENQHERNNQWFIKNAKDADLEVDTRDFMNMSSNNQREQGRYHNAQYAKRQLHILLSKPIKAQRFGKFFLSTANATTNLSSLIVPAAAAIVETNKKSGGVGKRKRRRRR